MRLADLTDEFMLSALGVGEILRAMLDAGRTPETHLLRDRLMAEGFDGVVYPSFMSPGGTCVALWRWNGKGAPRLEAIDPEHRLPKTPASWI